LRVEEPFESFRRSSFLIRAFIGSYFAAPAARCAATGAFLMDPNFQPWQEIVWPALGVE
jgi:hypothetical protein